VSEQQMPPLAQAIIRSARDYKGYTPQGFVVEEHTCHNCIRKQFSFPYTCDDGWDNLRSHPEYGVQGQRCANWTDTSKCRVDALG
jgi:hypothetical protein